MTVGLTLIHIPVFRATSISLGSAMGVTLSLNIEIENYSNVDE